MQDEIEETREPAPAEAPAESTTEPAVEPTESVPEPEVEPAEAPVEPGPTTTPEPETGAVIPEVIAEVVEEVEVSQLGPNDIFEYGGVQYQLLSRTINVRDLKTGVAGQIDSSALVRRL